MNVARLVKWAIGVVVALVVLIVVALVAVPYLVDTPRIQAYIATNASQTLGRPVKFSSVSLRVLPYGRKTASESVRIAKAPTSAATR